jgi:hypothetical protein
VAERLQAQEPKPVGPSKSPAINLQIFSPSGLLADPLIPLGWGPTCVWVNNPEQEDKCSNCVFILLVCGCAHSGRCLGPFSLRIGGANRQSQTHIRLKYRQQALLSERSVWQQHRCQELQDNDCPHKRYGNQIPGQGYARIPITAPTVANATRDKLPFAQKRSTPPFISKAGPDIAWRSPLHRSIARTNS